MAAAGLTLALSLAPLPSASLAVTTEQLLFLEVSPAATSTAFVLVYHIVLLLLLLHKRAWKQAYLCNDCSFLSYISERVISMFVLIGVAFPVTLLM